MHTIFIIHTFNKISNSPNCFQILFYMRQQSISIGYRVLRIAERKKNPGVVRGSSVLLYFRKTLFPKNFLNTIKRQTQGLHLPMNSIDQLISYKSVFKTSYSSKDHNQIMFISRFYDFLILF